MSKQRMKLLVKNDILPPVIFLMILSSVWIMLMEKKTSSRKKGSTRSKETLEIVHTDICGIFSHANYRGT